MSSDARQGSLSPLPHSTHVRFLFDSVDSCTAVLLYTIRYASSLFTTVTVLVCWGKQYNTIQYNTIAQPERNGFLCSYIINDLFCWMNPFMILLLSKAARDKFLVTFHLKGTAKVESHARNPLGKQIRSLALTPRNLTTQPQSRH